MKPALITVNFLAIFLFATSVFAQQPAEKKEYYDGPNKKERKALAWEQINALNNGVLLVRLATYSKKVEALKKNGRTSDAERVQQEQAAKHQEIVAAFSNYSFSKVYFFYSEHSGAIKRGAFEGVVLDANLQTVADLDGYQQDVFVLDSEKAFLASMNEFQLGFTVMNQQLEVLDSPFPSVVRKRKGTVVAERSYFDMVLVLQGQLEEYMGISKTEIAADEKRKARKAKRKQNRRSAA